MRITSGAASTHRVCDYDGFHAQRVTEITSRRNFSGASTEAVGNFKQGSERCFGSLFRLITHFAGSCVPAHEAVPVGSDLYDSGEEGDVSVADFAASGTPKEDGRLLHASPAGSRDAQNENAPDLTGRGRFGKMEHETGLEPATPTLARRRRVRKSLDLAPRCARAARQAGSIDAFGSARTPE